MSINRYKPHLLILPEDDANRQIAVGFFLVQPFTGSNRQILPLARGWPGIRDSFDSQYNSRLQQFPECIIALLVDFDNKEKENRLEQVKRDLNPSFLDRVFVLGVTSEPEKLKKTLGSYEKIGKALAKDCLEGTTHTWSHELLAHNLPEIERLQPHIDRIFKGQ
jgi:hypothetical protein